MSSEIKYIQVAQYRAFYLQGFINGLVNFAKQKGDSNMETALMELEKILCADLQIDLCL